MPLYFAYGSNMDEAALRSRCPGARKLCTARLARHRFALMSSGYATVRRDPGAEVYGVLFDLALSDIAPLDRYEEVDGGLYVKEILPVLRDGGHPSHALVYVGCDERDAGCTVPGCIVLGYIVPGYMEAVVAAARGAGLPPPYVAMLDSFVAAPGPRRR